MQLTYAKRSLDQQTEMRLSMCTCTGRRDGSRLGDDGGNGGHRTSGGAGGREEVGRYSHTRRLMVVEVVEGVVHWQNPIGSSHSSLCWIRRKLSLQVSLAQLLSPNQESSGRSTYI